MNNNTFDFGFSIVDEQELEAVQTAHQKAETLTTTSAEMESRLTKLYDAFQPLLNNLKKSADKDYIWWPDRLEKIEAFQDMLDSIYSGKQ
jgi:hypothetical protein